MSRRFYFGSPSESDDDTDALPYPEPLARNAFLTPDFTPTDFLSSLRNRHQTLEDLRAELRTRSQELSKELLDLVNDNYEGFLGLGNDLRGGDEKVEEVRVGLLGFKREIDSLKEKTEARRQEAEAHVLERQQIVQEMRTGKDLLEIDSRLEDLERSLDITPKANGHSKRPTDDANLDLSDESDSEIDEDTSAVPLSKIHRRVQQYTDMQRLVKRVGPQHPFIAAQDPRLKKIKQTLLMDLANTLKQCKKSDSQAQTLKVLKLYETIGAAKEALFVLRISSKS